MSKKKTSVFMNEISRGVMAIGVVLVMWLMSSTFALGLGVIFFSFQSAGKTFIGAGVVGYLVLLYGAFLAPQFKVLLHTINGGNKE